MNALPEIPQFIDARSVANHRRKNKSRYDAILQILEKKELGEIVVLEGLDQGDLNNLTQLGVRRGMSIRRKRVADTWYVFKSKTKMHVKTIAAGKEIMDRITSGETYDAIGQDLGVTRQAIEQKVSTYKRFIDMPPNKRPAAVDDFIAPFLIKVNTEALPCLLCKETGESDEKKRQHGICGLCRQAIRIRRTAASRLRSYIKSGNRHMLAEAMVLIRRYNLTPEQMIL